VFGLYVCCCCFLYVGFGLSSLGLLKLVFVVAVWFYHSLVCSCSGSIILCNPSSMLMEYELLLIVKLNYLCYYQLLMFSK